jgi:hypothetical protein
MNIIQISFLQQNGQKKTAAFSTFDRLHSNKIHKIQNCPQKHLHSPHIDATLEAEAGGC